MFASSWQPIETAPKDGSRILVGWPNGAFDFLIWKTNGRIVRGHAAGEDANGELAESYFGDPVECDDYELAKAENFPTVWLPFDPPSPS